MMLMLKVKKSVLEQKATQTSLNIRMKIERKDTLKDTRKMKIGMI